MKKFFATLISAIVVSSFYKFTLTAQAANSHHGFAKDTIVYLIPEEDNENYKKTKVGVLEKSSYFSTLLKHNMKEVSETEEGIEIRLYESSDNLDNLLAYLTDPSKVSVTNLKGLIPIAEYYQLTDLIAYYEARKKPKQRLYNFRNSTVKVDDNSCYKCLFANCNWKSRDFRYLGGRPDYEIPTNAKDETFTHLLEAHGCSFIGKINEESYIFEIEE